MSESKPNRRMTYALVPMRESHSPIGLYWGMPLAMLLAMAGMTAALWMSPDRTGKLVTTAICIALVALTAYFTLRQLRWDRQTQQGRLDVLDTLTTMVGSVGTTQGTEELTISRLPRALASLMAMNISTVLLLEEDGQTLRIVAESKMAAPTLGRRFPLTAVPIARECVLEKRIVTVADARNPGRPINKELVKELNLRCMVLIPMIYQDKVLGILSLADDRPRALTDIDLRRASMWGKLAAVMIAHCRLYEQMRGALDEQKMLMVHRNALFETHTAIQQPGTLDEVLQRIVELAPATLQVDAAMVWLPADDNPDELWMAAATTPFQSPVAGFRMPIGNSRAGIVFKTGRTVVVEDGVTDDQLNSDLKKLLPHGSLILEPLIRRDGGPLGVIVLMRQKIGEFRPDQRELAHMLSLRAAAVIEMARLYQQTVSDAEARAMLLRELNHRVKNNLAGIISLLSLHPPAMPRDARRWLDRAIGRIEAMAQAHDLFSAGAQRVTLKELVERTVRSMSVVKPAGVTIKTDLAAGRALLRTNRAVSLAMAIHELCFNGLVHGLRDKGTLTIRARRENGDLAVEVEDDSGRPPTIPIEPPPGSVRSISDGSHSGVGLSLVRGLVGRELRGQFSLVPGGGGAKAMVQFPLLADELSEGAI